MMNGHWERLDGANTAQRGPLKPVSGCSGHGNQHGSRRGAQPWPPPPSPPEAEALSSLSCEVRCTDTRPQEVGRLMCLVVQLPGRE